PNNSVVIIDWSVVEPSIAISNPSGKVEINLTSPVIRELANAIARGDVIGIYANASDENTIEFVLAYSWARAVNNELVLIGTDFHEKVPDYLIVYPIIPVSNKEPVIFMVRWIRPRGLVIGPIYPNQLTQFVSNIMGQSILVSGMVDSPYPSSSEPCYSLYEEYEKYSASSPSTGIYVANDTTLIWAAPLLTSYTVPGIDAYSDGNGTFYWDTCLEIGNQIQQASSELYWLAMNTVGFVAYGESSTMYNNGGLEDSQIGAIDYYSGYSPSSTTYVADPGWANFGNGWLPKPTGGISGYSIGVGLGTGISVSVSISMPVGTESIGGSYGPSTQVDYGYTQTLGNITWTFNIGQSADNAGFANVFEDNTPAMLSIVNFNPSQQYVATFNVDFENNAITAQYPCAYKVYQTIWAQTTWEVIVTPQSSSTASINVYRVLPITISTTQFLRDGRNVILNAHNMPISLR
ncbi:hypothetical protein, partial [Vulcanisaeta sp. JCM 16161]|uniref:hypothetical protein n=1 Tax=Vulcanisaeta sp. JCM 16161 TaxID=1295372 RepID=UPI0006D1D09B